MSLEQILLPYAADKLTQYCGRVETCIDKLTPEQVWTRDAENTNAIGNLVLHLAGNVRQWILHGVGGEADTRVRDTEFAARGGLDPAELKHRLRSTVDAAAVVIRATPFASLCERRSIQKYDVTVIEAILHVVEHFSGHTAQIIFITKFLTGEDLGFYAHLGTSRAHGEKQP